MAVEKIEQMNCTEAEREAMLHGNARKAAEDHRNLVRSRRVFDVLLPKKWKSLGQGELQDSPQRHSSSRRNESKGLISAPSAPPRLITLVTRSLKT